MKQLELKQLIKLSYEICEMLAKANVGNILLAKKTLKDLLREELYSFALYLAGADDRLEEKEKKVIQEIFGDESFLYDSLASRAGEKAVSADFADKLPESLKYAVLADAGHKLSPDPYKGQKAMIFYDTFKLLGQTILVQNPRDVSDITGLKFTLYIDRMEKFIKELAVWYPANQKIYRPVSPVESDFETVEEKSDKLEELLEKLNGMIGLANVKHQAGSIVNLIRVQKMRENQGMKVTDVSKHMVFMGNPGTGKTTVARILAEVYKYLGVLRKGQLIEVDRSGLVRGYVGQTASRSEEHTSELQSQR